MRIHRARDPASLFRLNCVAKMQELAWAERSHGDRVTVYKCKVCGRIDSLGEASSPWWVGARARSFLELREEAFRRAGREASPAIALFELATQQVIFG
jgi:hypothetical protein